LIGAFRNGVYSQGNPDSAAWLCTKKWQLEGDWNRFHRHDMECNEAEAVAWDIRADKERVCKLPGGRRFYMEGKLNLILRIK